MQGALVAATAACLSVCTALGMLGAPRRSPCSGGNCTRRVAKCWEKVMSELLTWVRPRCRRAGCVPTLGVAVIDSSDRP